MTNINISFTAGEKYYSVYLKHNIITYVEDILHLILYPLIFQYDFSR